MIDFTPSAELYPFTSKWHDGPHGRVHYIDEGAGRPILFLHGNPTWSFLYRNIVVALRGRFRCIAPDYPGFGLSARPSDYGYTPREHAEAVSALVADLGLTDVIVMGQDWGGPIGIATALEHADKVSGLVFGNTWFWPADKLSTVAFSRVMSSPPLQWLILQRNFFVEKLIPAGCARALPDEVMRHYRAVQPTPGDRAGLAAFPVDILRSRPWMAELASQVPETLATKQLLLVWGVKDFAFTPGHHLPRWEAAFDDVTTVLLEDAKHFIQEDAPGTIARAIADRFG